MTKNKALHPRDNVDWLHVLKKEGARGFASIEDIVDASIQRLEDYIEKHEGGLITTIENDFNNTVTNRMTITRKQKRLINDNSHEKKKIWAWLRNRNFKIKTESLLIAAQNNAIRTNQIKARIDKTQQNSKCKAMRW